MTDKKDDDLKLDERLAEDLVDDMDDIEGLEDLDEIDDFDNLDDDLDDMEVEDTNSSNQEEVETDSAQKGDSATHEEKDIEELDEEISSLNNELDELEDENLEDDEAEVEDDESDFEEDPEEEPEEDPEEEMDLDAIEEKERKKKTLIMRGATGAFVIMAGGFLYNLMFAGEIPNEQNIVSPVAQEQNAAPEPVSIDTTTPNMDSTFDAFEKKATKDIDTKEPLIATEEPSNRDNKDTTSSTNDEDSLSAVSDDKKSSNSKEDDGLIVEPDTTKVEASQQPEQGIDLDSALRDKLVKDLSRGQGVHINSDGKIVGQDNHKTYELYVGQTIPYYSYNVDVVSIFFDGELALLSNGTYIDKNRIKVDENLMKMANTQKELETKEKELREKREKEEKDRALRIAEERAREEERMKAQEQQKLQEEKLKKALERINTLANEIESSKKKEVESPKPKLLEGWSVNGEFKAIRNGFVLNGYLVRDAEGNFYKMLVGDTHEEFGIIRGYDGNGRFFIGNGYIL